MEVEVPKPPLFSFTNIVEKAPVFSVLGAVIFFVVAHPALFGFVDSIVESILGVGVQRDLLVLIHSLVFGALIFGATYLIDFLASR